ncbi:helix-turn-helix domain-containing protein [Micromonospora sp. B11E3]|uniref:helix-turn-helix domain-containing protein n=1 Tax=Micromonospora sp. B11E3 TaxID=3153562 RepID=UPI00325E9AAF
MNTTDAGRMEAFPEFGRLLRRLRTDRGWSLRDLADRIRFNRGYISKVELGEKFPEQQFAQLADGALDAGGLLVAAWEADAHQRREAASVGRLLLASTRDSLRLITTDEERMGLDDLDEATRAVAVGYLGTPPAPMLRQAVELRSEALRRMKQHQYKPGEVADLYLIIGRLQGVLSYSALDLGDADAAMVHADAAMVCAERAGSNELRGWVRGTQSLIARFRSDYTSALNYVLDGLRGDVPGTGRLRLLCGYAQCHANLGDSAGSNQALDAALKARDKVREPDSVGGIFEFSEAKQHYYAGSSLIWLDGGADAERAAREAGEAINLWRNEPPETRSLDDEALAHVYQGTAYLQLGQLDAATAAVRPILELPPERQISWIHKRLDRFDAMLLGPRYAGSHEASELHDEIQALAV